MSEPAPAIVGLGRSATEASETTRKPPSGPADRASGDSTDKPPQATAADQNVVTYPHPPDYFTEALEDAERLLWYAAEIGVAVDDNTRNSVLNARVAVTAGWNEKTAADLLAALTSLAAKLKPVTAESLRSFNTRPTVRTYWLVAICLAIVIVPFSVASFITAGLSNLINKDITTANEMAVKLGTQANPSGNAAGSSPPAGLSPTDVATVTEFQTFASLTRSIYGRSRQLNAFILRRVYDPFTNDLKEKDGYKNLFELPVPLPGNLQPVLTERITVFQKARQFGQDVMDDISVSYGAIATCILPVLYALLGTCAYLLRSFSQEMGTRTFVPSHSDSARFLIAAIAGGVVGLFNNFTIGQGASIPPLAIAFVVGYAADVFFTFLEGIIQTFTKGKSSTPAPGPATSQS